MYTYLTAMRNSRVVPLTYLIQKTPDPPGIFIDREHYIIQNAPLQGNIFSCYTKKFLVILKELTVYTDSGTWMKEKRCGLEAMLEL